MCGFCLGIVGIFVLECYCSVGSVFSYRFGLRVLWIGGFVVGSEVCG